MADGEAGADLSTDVEEEKLSESEAQGSPALTSEQSRDKQADAHSQPPETGSEDLDSVDLSDLLSPKPLDFEVIDFEQFGPQPPDLPRSDSPLDHEEEVDQSGAEFTQPEAQISHVDSGVPQEMETLSDGPEKTGVVPNMIEELELDGNFPSLTSEDKEGHDVPKDLEPATEKAVQQLRQLAQEQAKQLEDARQQLELSTTQLAKQTIIHEELKRDLEAESDERLKTDAKLMVLNEVLPNIEEKLRNVSNELQEEVKLRTKLEEDLQQESKELEEQVNLRTKLEEDLQQGSKQLEEQVNLRTKLEEDLQQESKQLEEQVNLRTKLEEDLQQESKQLEEQANLRTKLEEDLQQESKQLEEQIELKNELTATLEQKVQHIAGLEEQTKELAHKFEEEQDGRMKSEADLMVLREMLSHAEEKLKDVHDQVESLVAQLQEQTELRHGLEEKLDRQGKEKLLQQDQIHQDLALQLEQERDERRKVETSLEELRGSLANKEEELKEARKSLSSKEEELKEARESLSSKEEGLKEVRESLSSKEEELKEARESLSSKEEELKEFYENLSNKDMQLKELRESFSNNEELKEALESLSNKEHELKGSLSNKVEELKELHESLSNKDMQLNEALESLSNKEQELKEVYEILSSKEQELNEALESMSNKEQELNEALESLSNKEQELNEALESLSNKEQELNEALESMSNKEQELNEALESMSNKEQELNEALESLSNKEQELNEALESLSNKEQELNEALESLSNNEQELNEALESLSNKEGELTEIFESLLRKEEELKGQRDQVALLTVQLQEKEREERFEERMVSDPSSESLPVSSMPWSEEKLELVKLLDEQKTLLANQVLEAEKLKSSAQQRVGLLNHQVQNLEVLTDIAETMEHVFSAKERAIKQALWTVTQAVCLGMGFVHFVVAYRDPLRSSLQPT